MDVMLVSARRSNVGELIVGHPGRQLFPDLVCFFRRDLIRLESLTDVIEQNLIFDFPAGVFEILLPVQHEPIDRCFRHAGV